LDGVKLGNLPPVAAEKCGCEKGIGLQVIALSLVILFWILLIVPSQATF
jgi:hypothetical protein